MSNTIYIANKNNDRIKVYTASNITLFGFRILTTMEHIGTIKKIDGEYIFHIKTLLFTYAIPYTVVLDIAQKMLELQNVDKK
jgi:hypothetical protein